MAYEPPRGGLERRAEPDGREEQSADEEPDGALPQSSTRYDVCQAEKTITCEVRL